MLFICCGVFAILLTCIIVPPVWYALLAVLRILVRSDLLFHTLNLIWEAVCLGARIIGYLFNLTCATIPSVCSNIMKFIQSIYRTGSFLFCSYGIVGLTVGIFMVIICLINVLDMLFGLRNPEDVTIQHEHKNYHNNNQGQTPVGNTARFVRRVHIQQNGEIRENERVQHVDGDNLCGVCFERTRDTALFPCGHTQMCGACVAIIRQSTNKCPICLSGIREHRQIYL